MTKKIGTIIVFVLGGTLLVYSATRSLDFITLTLPADRAVLAYFGLAALDGGLVAWVLSFLHGSKGWQRAISFLMVVIDLLGAIAMFTLDTLYNTGKAGMTAAMTPDQMQTAVLALSGVIGLNIAAAVAHHMTDPEKLREQAEEVAFSKVEDATLKQIEKNANQLAAQLAPTLAADWMQQTKARYMANIGTGRVGTILDLPAQDVTPAQSAPLMPVVIPQAQPQQAKPFNLSTLWAGLFKNNNGRTYQSVTVAPELKPTEAKADSSRTGGLYDAMKQGIAEAQGVTPDKLYSPVDGIARALSESPKDAQSFTDAPKSE